MAVASVEAWPSHPTPDSSPLRCCARRRPGRGPLDRLPAALVRRRDDGRRSRRCSSCAAQPQQPRRDCSPRPTSATWRSKRLQWGSTADWVTHCAGVHRREGGASVRHAGPAGRRPHRHPGRAGPRRDLAGAGRGDLRRRRGPAGQPRRCGPSRAAAQRPGEGADRDRAGPGPDGTSRRWSTPTASDRRARPRWTARSAPPTCNGSSPSSTTAPAASGSRAADRPRTARSCAPRCCR